jgi:hypothetical protein
MRIRFKAIKEIAEEVLGEPVEIHLSSQLRDIVGCIAQIDGSLHILINSNICKTEEQVVAVTIHEISHKLAGSSSHCNLFYNHQDKLVETFSKRLSLDSSTLFRLLEHSLK